MSKAESKPPEVAMPKGIHRKLVAIMGDIGWIEKDKRNQSQGYNFTSAEDVANEVRKLCAHYGVDVEPDVMEHSVRVGQTAKGGTIYFHDVTVGWTFVDADTGEKVGPCRTVGTGMDSGDKGVFKAMTGALKYALRMKFLIPFGDDPEEDNEAERDLKKGGAKPSANGDARAAIQARTAVPSSDAERVKNVADRFTALGLPLNKVKVKEFTGKPFDGAHMSAEEWTALDAKLRPLEQSRVQQHENVDNAAEILGAAKAKANAEHNQEVQ